MSDGKNTPSTADHVGQAAGGITGVVAGAAIGSSAGPIGTLLGGVAGAIGGWWSGRALAEAAEDITSADEEYYRSHFDSASDRPSEYERTRHAYYLGQVAAANPDYAGRAFDDVEDELSRGWTRGGGAATGGERSDWQSVRGYVNVGFTRGRERRRSTESPDRVSGSE